MQSSNSPQGEFPDLQARERLLSQWLEAVGFKWNPFSKIDANDEPYLGEYFIYPSGFEEMLGKNSAVLYAPRGGGKTASRRMVEHFCAIGEVPGKIFCVTHDNFERVVERAEQGLDSVTARMHVEAILRNAIPLLFYHLIQNPELVYGFEDLAYLRQFIKQFTDCLTDYRLNQVLKGTGVIKKDIMDALAHENLDGLLLSLVEDYRPRVQFVVALLEQGTVEVSLDELTPTQLLERFLNLVKAVGFDALFILVDNVDGLPQTDGNPQACVTLLSALVGTASLMSLPGVFFKFFLPPGTKALLESFRAFQIKQVRPVEVGWTADKLLEVLQSRLSAATQEGRAPITSLDAVSEERVRDRIDGELVRYSETPRDVFLLGQEVFQAHIHQSPEKEYLTAEDLEFALKPRKEKERAQHRQEFLRRWLRWGGISLAAVFALTSFLTWLLFILPLYTPITSVLHTSLSIFARHPRYLAMGGESEIGVTVTKAGAVEVADIRTCLIFPPTFHIEFPKGSVVNFGSLTESNKSITQGIRFRPLEAGLAHFDLKVITEGGVEEIIEGGMIRIVPVPSILVERFFMQPLSSVLSAIVAALSKQIAEFFVEIVERLRGSQPATGEDKK